MNRKIPQREATASLRYGWTTGACATAATAAAYGKLLTNKIDDPIQIRLPKGEEPEFPVECVQSGDGWVQVGIIKDAGDDPDVTNGALILSRVKLLNENCGIVFKAGEGVGTVTRPGLSIPVGEPAINPIPRVMMSEVIRNIAKKSGISADVEIEISIPDGEKLAEKTMNARLGILGGLSILGTTGIVRPFSCASWIASIHRGIDVARAARLTHVAGATGSTSERAVQMKYGLSEQALLDMGDFAGGLLKYLRRNPIPKLTIAGGPGKITKLAQGNLDLHSSRSSVDFGYLGELLGKLGLNESSILECRNANTAKQVFEMAACSGLPLSGLVANLACKTVREVLGKVPIESNVLIVDRIGNVIGESCD